jgi:hypothetical protein
MRLDRDPAHRHVFDAMTRERLEQLTRMEGVAARHRLGGVPRLTAASPARSSEATVFQFRASSSRSDIGRRRASMTASGTASGSRTASATGSAPRAGSFGEDTESAYRAHRSRSQ